jgi:hypothetical protein
MKFLIKIATFTLCLGALSACQATDESFGVSSKQVNYLKGENVVRQYTGEGICMTCFNSYRTRDDKKAFAMSKAGAFGIASGHKTSADAQRAALNSCRSSSKGAGCKLLMVGDRFVWK